MTTELVPFNVASPPPAAPVDRPAIDLMGLILARA